MPIIKRHKPGLITAFSFAIWNAPDIVERTNCLTYALGEPEMGRAVPGALTDPTILTMGPLELTKENLRRLMLKDGLLEITGKEALSRKFHAIALRFQPYQNFHALRYAWDKQNDGHWLHKPGRTPLIRTDDDSHSLIRNPETAALRRFPEFVGYFAIPVDGILYAPRLNEPPPPAEEPEPEYD